MEMGYIPHMKDEWKKRLRAAISDSGLSMKDVSLRAGKGETFVRDLLERDRIPSIDNFLAIAKAVQRSAAYLLGEETNSPVEPNLRRVEVKAFVQAGHFAESWEWDEEERYAVYVPDLPEYRSLELHAAETRGPSMNRRYLERTVVVFISLIEAQEEPIIGKRYIVERRHPSGEVEHTVKLLHAGSDGKLWLMPESDDPRFQVPISVEDDASDDASVIIIGRVVFAVTRE